MAHVSNFKQANAKILLDLVNADNEATLTTPLTVDQVSFSAPVVVGAPGTLPTKVTMTGVAAEGFKGSAELTYNRVNLNFMNPEGTEDLFVEVTTETQISQVIAQLNERFGIQLTADDVVEGALPAAPAEGQVAPFTITAAAGSLVWTGSVQAVRTGELADISDLVLVTTLDGLTAPEVS